MSIIVNEKYVYLISIIVQGTDRIQSFLEKPSIIAIDFSILFSSLQVFLALAVFLCVLFYF
jgi:hypothetical protein